MYSGHLGMIVEASLVTLELAFVSLALGLVLSVIFAVSEMSPLKILAWLMTLLVTIIRGLPELLVVLFVFFGAGHLISIIMMTDTTNPFAAGVVALALIFASYAAQTWRGAFKAIPKGQKDAANALGLNNTVTFFRIILPQAVRHALPGLTNQWLVLLKDTALVYFIGVTDLFSQAKIISAATHQGFTWYAYAAAIYLVITIITQQLIRLISKKYQLKENTSSNKKREALL